MNRWLTSREFRNKYKISSATLWRRANVAHTVQTKVMYGTTYYLDEDENVSSESQIDENSLNVIYCRVSNTKQRLDLDRQETLLREYCVKNGIKPDLVLRDIATGMKEDRTGFRELLSLVKDNKVKTVYISCKDRLTRFGYGYFEYLFGLFGTKIEVINLTKEEDFQQELTQDFISIIHYFSMKMYSNRSKDMNILKKELEEEVNSNLNENLLDK